MKVFENLKEVTLMIWETNPRNRNKINIVTFVSDKKTKIREGDCILGLRDGNGNISTYNITKIIDSRASKLKNKIYYTVETKWQWLVATAFKEHSNGTINLAMGRLRQIEEENSKKKIQRHLPISSR